MKRKNDTKEILLIVYLALATICAIVGLVFVWLHLVFPYAIIFFSISVSVMIIFIIALPKKKKEGTKVEPHERIYKSEIKKNKSSNDEVLDYIDGKKRIF